MGKPKDVTSLVVGASIIGLLGYELYTLVNEKKKDTISETVWRASAKRPLVPFALGMLVGHFVWQAQHVYDDYAKE